MIICSNIGGDVIAIAPDWITAVGTLALAFATLVLAIVAIFQDKIRGWLRRPKLVIDIKLAPPDSHKTVLERRDHTGKALDSFWCYYFRLRIRNEGNHRAELVEVFAKRLLRQQEDKSFKEVSSFLPMNLLWSHIRRPFIEAISSGIEKSCDLGHMVGPSRRALLGSRVNDGQLSFIFDVEVEPPNDSHVIRSGIYHLELIVGAANAKPIKKTLAIEFNGNWFDRESEMFEKGIRIRMI